MIYLIQKIIPLMLLIPVLMSCTSKSTHESVTMVDPSDKSRTTREYPPKQEEDLPSFDTDLPAFFVPPSPLLVEPYHAELSLSSGQEEKIGETITHKIIEGYRIQLFSGREEWIAKKIKAGLKVKYLEKVYLIYEAPFYKVRIGDFRNRDNAIRFCRQMREDGYREGWVVKSIINY
ncbi:SPOR domain-containing protein [bacterium]|nr:SPOR domain-containing protein [bacterium]